jgi:hypothetical protein
MKSYIKYLLISVIISGCSNKFYLTGKYASNNSPYASNNSPFGFNINNDSTFEYKFYQFHNYESSTGMWYKVGKNKIALNSFYKNLAIPLKVVEMGSNKDSINSISFQINGIEIDEKDCECALFINDTLKEIKRCDSMKSYSTKEAIRKIYIEIRKRPLLLTSFRFSLEPLVTNFYSTSNEYGNLIKFEIIINNSLFSYRVFNNTIIKIKEKGIFFYNDKGGKKYWIPRLKTIKSQY